TSGPGAPGSWTLVFQCRALDHLREKFDRPGEIGRTGQAIRSTPSPIGSDARGRPAPLFLGDVSPAEFLEKHRLVERLQPCRAAISGTEHHGGHAPSLATRR